MRKLSGVTLETFAQKYAHLTRENGDLALREATELVLCATAFMRISSLMSDSGMESSGIDKGRESIKWALERWRSISPEINQVRLGASGVVQLDFEVETLKVPTDDALLEAWCPKDFWHRWVAQKDAHDISVEHWKACAPRYEVPDAWLGVAEAEDLLERTWADPDAQVRQYADTVFVKTATLGEVDLWTRPMSEKPDASEGLSFIFVDSSGELVDGFCGSRNCQQVRESSLDWFTRCAAGAASAVWPSIKESQPDFDRQLDQRSL